jgi:ankyrin repeat protein
MNKQLLLILSCALLFTANSKPGEEPTLLWAASQEGDLETVRALACFSNVNRSFQGRTPLDIASKNNHHLVVQELLRAKANMRQEQNKPTALHLAATIPNSQALIVLLEAKANVNARYMTPEMRQRPPFYEADQMPLTLAARENCAENVTRLAAAKASIDASGALGEAVANGSIPIIEHLLSLGANTNGRSPALRNKYTAEDPNFFHSYRDRLRYINLSPLEIAGILRRADLVKLLADHKANFNSVHLHQIAKTTTPDIMTIFLEKCNNEVLQETDYEECLNPLFFALENPDWRVLELMLAADVDPNKISPYRKILIGRSIELNNIKAIQLLAQAKANLDMIVGGSCDGLRPLHRAAEVGNLKVIRVLAHAKADLESLCLNGNTAIGVAAMNNKIDAMLALAELGANVNGGIHEAAEYNNMEALKTIVALKADVNLPSERQMQTPLYSAKAPETVRFFLDAGADPEVLNRYRETPAEYIKYKEFREVSKQSQQRMLAAIELLENTVARIKRDRRQAVKDKLKMAEYQLPSVDKTLSIMAATCVGFPSTHYFCSKLMK